MGKLRIGIDARFSVRQPRRGIGTYSVNLLAALVALDRQIDFFLYVDGDDNDGSLPSGPNVFVRRLWPRFYPLWEQFCLSLAIRMDRLDLLHSLGNTGPLSLPSRIRFVLTLHDVMFLQSEAITPTPRTIYQRAGRIYRACFAPRNARRSDAVITISEFSRGDILNQISELDSERVIPIYEACDPRYTPCAQSASSSDRPFFLCLGAEDPRKNTLRIVEAYLSAIANFAIEDDLIICGYSNWEGSPAHRLVQRENAQTRVRFMAFVSVDDLAALYRKATALLYISLYEGFGIPLLEAFSSGCPVIASNATSIPEVGGDAAIYVNPTEISDIELAIVRMSNTPSLRSHLRSRGLERAAQFSWEMTARETLAVYRQVLDGL